MLVCALALATGCRQHQKAAAQAAPPPPKPQVKIAPPTPLDVKKVELGGKTWDPAWDITLEKELPAVMLSWRVPHDVRLFCPNFYRMTTVNKRAFWAYFFQALASAEAGLNPTSNVKHTEAAVAVIDPVTHEITHQEGLLQLTYDDAKRYNCNFDWNRDKHLPPHDPRRSILNPRNNLECGIRILANQMFHLREGLLARDSYWATLQPGTLSYRVFAKQMTNAPAACELPEHEREERDRRARHLHTPAEETASKN